jgi:hypothetical protein
MLLKGKADSENIQSDANGTWYCGIDYLRCFMALAVVAWHVRLFGETGFFNIDEYATYTIGWVDVLYFHGFLLAVPVFFLIALYMFIDRQTIPLTYLTARIERLSWLFLFWLGAALLIYLDLNNESISELFHFWTDHFDRFALFFFSGGFTLYYFFLDLIFLTVFAYWTAAWHCRYQWALATISLVQLWVFPAVVRWFDMWPMTVAYWNILNFIPYVFISNLIHHYRNRLRSPRALNGLIVVLAVAAIVTAVGEWQWFMCRANFQYNNFALPPYMRISVAIGTTLLFVIALSLSRPAPIWVKFISDNSLGLYCLHQIVMIVLQKVDGYEKIHHSKIVEYVMVVSISLFLTPIIRRAFRSGLI